MTERPPPPTYRMAPVLALWPELRRPTARLRIRAQAMYDVLCALLPVAEQLARDHTLADHSETTPYDHLAADAIAAVHQLMDALDELARPITLEAPLPPVDDRLDF